MKLDAAQLRESNPSPEEIASVKRNPLYIIVDNVLDTYNVGAIFRLADAAAVSGVYLVGQTNIPTDEKVGHKIQKASVGTWKWTPWEHVDSIADAIEMINNQLSIINKYSNSNAQNANNQILNTNLQVVAIEQSDKSVPYTEFDYQFPLALILGHETEGVSKEGLEIADAIVEIPLFGVNKSLNVMMSLGIVMWHVMRKIDIVKV
ncbi:MAG: hypothetical protein NUV98_02220 [Candidatus Roizmanbacteria bacterium]|nr:hypothetical protein [Candidatus Roizmanbacteria bacterium]